MTINLEYLDGSPKRLNILIEQIKNSNDIQTLSNISKENLRAYYYAQKRLFEINNTDFKEAEFVTIGNKQNKLIKLMVFRSNNEDNPFTKKIKKLLNFEFDAIFEDENFDGDSYQLAMYVAAYSLLNERNIKDNYCFSGVIDMSLNISTHFFEEKQKFAKKHCKILLGENLSIKEILLQSLKSERKLILAKDEETNIPPGFKVLKIGVLPKKDWSDFIKQAACFIKPNDEVAFNCPASFAFGVGAYLGSIYSYKVLHFQMGEYVKVFDTSRRIKTIDNDFRDLILSPLESSPKEFNILLHFASHEPTPPTKKPTIKIEPAVKGNIALEDYEETIRQINNAINYLKGQHQFKKVNLVFSMPVAMAFGLGCAIGKFLAASVYHYFFDSASYFKVFDLNHL